MFYAFKQKKYVINFIEFNTFILCFSIVTNNSVASLKFATRYHYSYQLLIDQNIKNY